MLFRLGFHITCQLSGRAPVSRHACSISLAPLASALSGSMKFWKYWEFRGVNISFHKC